MARLKESLWGMVQTPNGAKSGSNRRQAINTVPGHYPVHQELTLGRNSVVNCPAVRSISHMPDKGTIKVPAGTLNGPLSVALQTSGNRQSFAGRRRTTSGNPHKSHSVRL